jgi:RNA polymerase sigma factor (sigma-70 family)
MKYLHEVFMKKLNPNLYRHDVLDIYQELCISLIDGIDKALSMKDLDTKTLSGRIWSRLMTGVNRVMKEYYDQGNHYLELPDPDIYEHEYPEDHEISRVLYLELGAREEAIIEDLYYRDKDLEEVGWNFGLTKERVRQIREKAIKKMRQAFDFSLEESERRLAFRKDIFRILRHYPKVHWVVFEDPEQPGPDMEYLESRGIDPREFLIISGTQSTGESYYPRVHYESWIPRQYYGNVYDLTLEAVVYEQLHYPFRYDIPREIKKLGGSKYLSDMQLRKLAIDSIYRRELRG